MKEKIEEIMQKYWLHGFTSPKEYEDEFTKILTTELGKAFDAGFNTTTEKFNAAFRDDYEIWGIDQIIRYNIEKAEFLKTYNL